MKDINFQIGMSAVQTVAEIAKFNSLCYLSFIIYNTYKKTRKGQPFSTEALLRHSDRTQERKIHLREPEFMVENIQKITNEISHEMALGVISKVSVAGETRHIPMMDFNCDASDENLERIKELLFHIGQKQGAILISGRSYHYYGTTLLPQEDWIDFLGKCLLFSGYVGQRYIGHSLSDGYSTLRVSVNNLRSVLPRIISIL